jgi:hypothetical protein
VRPGGDKHPFHILSLDQDHTEPRTLPYLLSLLKENFPLSPSIYSFHFFLILCFFFKWLEHRSLFKKKKTTHTSDMRGKKIYE